MIVRCEAEVRHIGAGDVTLIAPSVVTEREPEHHLTTTTLFADADYLIEHLFWQHLDIIPKGDAARSLAAKLYPESVKVLRVGGGNLKGWK